MENKNKTANQTLNDLLEALSNETKREPMQPTRITALAQAVSAVLVVAISPTIR